MQQAQLIQAQATAAQAAAPYKTTRKTYNRPARGHPRTTKPQAHPDKPKSHKGLWRTIHGSLTHNTETCYARRHQNHSTTKTAYQATAQRSDEEQTNPDDDNMHELHERVQYLEGMLADQHSADHGKETYILDSGAQPTHTAKPHADMQKSNGTLTQTANGHRARTAHTGTIRLKQKNKTMDITAVRAPQIREISSRCTISQSMDMSHSHPHTHICISRPRYPQHSSLPRITKANTS